MLNIQTGSLNKKKNIYRVSREDLPISRRGGLAARTKTGFLPFYLLIKKIIKNQEINEIKMLKRQYFQKN